jgi:hypothetical protein
MHLKYSSFEASVFNSLVLPPSCTSRYLRIFAAMGSNSGFCKLAALSLRASMARRTIAHASRLSVPTINPQTMILSLLLSRLKHMVKTSSSVASLQKEMPWLRQKAFVQAEHDVDAARASTFGEVSSAWSSTSRSRKREESSWCSGPRGMMVLFLKHVHLQNVGAPAMVSRRANLAQRRAHLRRRG